MPTPPGFAEFTFNHIFAGVTGFASVVVGFDPGEVSEARAIAIQNAWQDDMLFAISNDVQYVGAVARFGVDGEDDTIFELTPNGALATFGQRAGNMIPGNSCVLVKKNTGLGGKANRGRMYLPGALEADYGANGRLTSAAQGAIQGFVSGFLSTLAALAPPCDMVILHSPPSVAAPTLVTSLSVQPLIATQRRRIR